jgi:hypothetical protein
MYSSNSSYNNNFLLSFQFQLSRLSPILLILLLLINTKTSQVVVNGLSILNPNKIKPPIPLSQELGISPSLNYKFFDPLNLANEYNFALYREAELKHGRIAMVAVLGNTIPDFLPYLNPGGELQPSTGIKTVSDVPSTVWIQIVLLIGFLETQVFIQRGVKDLPGDYGLGYFGVRDNSRHWR